MHSDGLNRYLKRMTKQSKNNAARKAINWLAKSGKTIGDVLKWGTAIGLIVTLTINARNIKEMIYEDHKVIITVPAQMKNIENNYEAMHREYEIRWQEQHRIDSVQNKQFGENTEVGAVMSEANRVIKTAVEIIEAQKKNESQQQQQRNGSNP